MNADYHSLIERMQQRARDPVHFVDLPDAVNKAEFYKVPPPVSVGEMELAEHRLGFKLPQLLRQLYLKVGNGGFGPGYGLIGLNDRGARNFHSNLVETYIASMKFSQFGYPAWPPQFLTICDWGDGITSVLEWTSEENAVYRFNGDQYEDGSLEDVTKLESPSLQAWLEDWLAGFPLFKLA